MTKALYSLGGKRVWVAGHRGMVGSAIVRRLASENCEVLMASRSDADLRRQEEVERWLSSAKPDVVIVAAAKVGGILANDRFPAEFLYENLAIEANVIKAAHDAKVAKLLFLGSSCIYPKLAAQPIREEALLEGALEPTNEWYAVAKIAGIKLCQAFRRQYGDDYISAMPANLYGPGDNFDLRTSHVIPALMRKMHEAKDSGDLSVEIWGSGSVYREFMHVDDLADACIFLLRNYSDAGHINVGVGSDLSIRTLAEEIAAVVGYEGEFRHDTTKPDGTPRKLMDSGRLSALGWHARVELRAGLADTYAWFKANMAHDASGERSKRVAAESAQ